MDVRDYVEANAREFIDALKQWLTIPSISADPDRHADVRRSADWLAGYLRTAGFPVAEVWQTALDGLPAVYAEWPAADPAAARKLLGTPESATRVGVLAIVGDRGLAGSRRRRRPRQARRHGGGRQG